MDADVEENIKSMRHWANKIHEHNSRDPYADLLDWAADTIESLSKMDPETKELVKELKDFGYEYDDGPLGLALAQAANTIESLSKENADLKSYIKEQK